METRMERYAKYREKISQMAEEDFQPDGVPVGNREVSKEEVDSYVANDLSQEEIANGGPNKAYLNRRRATYIAQLIVGVLLFVALLVFGILIFGRH